MPAVEVGDGVDCSIECALPGTKSRSIVCMEQFTCETTGCIDIILAWHLGDGEAEVIALRTIYIAYELGMFDMLCTKPAVF
jgi:hypothetical protein